MDYEGGATSNFVEVTVPKGTDTSGYFIVVYDQSGYVIGAYSLGEVVSTNLGQDVYLMDTESTANFPDLNDQDAVALVNELGLVEQFLGFASGSGVTAQDGPADGMTSRQIGTSSGSLMTDDGGLTYYPVLEAASTPGEVDEPVAPTSSPSESPSASLAPSSSQSPSSSPSARPSTSQGPSDAPSDRPSSSGAPSGSPSNVPSGQFVTERLA